VRALNAAGARASFLEIESDKGHDAFLLDEPVMRDAVAGFLASAGQARGLGHESLDHGDLGHGGLE
jgi:homoserine O-acetyltransferase